MFFLLTIIFFIVLPILLVWRLCQVPVSRDTQTQLMLRGIVAGLTGGVIGATLSSFIYGVNGYAVLGFVYWLLFTAIFGMMFTFIVAGIQKLSLNLNLFTRSTIGGLLGILAAGLYLSAIRMDIDEINWFAKGVICMIVVSGITSGILANLPKKEV
jgi:hypothetical protein